VFGRSVTYFDIVDQNVTRKLPRKLQRHPARLISWLNTRLSRFGRTFLINDDQIITMPPFTCNVWPVI
jgi:hypothetical protein